MGKINWSRSKKDFSLEPSYPSPLPNLGGMRAYKEKLKLTKDTLQELEERQAEELKEIKRLLA